MSLVPYLRSLIARYFRRSAVEHDLDDELRAHIEHRADDLQRSGLDRAEAERRARIEFGGRERFKEECREAIGGNFLEVLITDVRFSLRVLRKSPAFLSTAVITLALAIGANAVVFGVLNALILRPLNVPGAESLYNVQHGTQPSISASYPDYVDIRDRNRSFDALAGINITKAGLDIGETPFAAWVVETTGNYFDVLRLRPYLGRFYHAPDEQGPNSAPYLVLSYSYWHTHFQDDRRVVGRTVRLNKHPFTIIGVAPPGFHGTLLFGDAELFVPLANQEQLEGQYHLNDRAHQSVFMTMGHLKPGVSPEQAVADLNSIGTYLERTYPKQHAPTSYSLGRPALAGDYFGRPVRAFLTGLTLLAGLILLAACANLGSLFAARTADRSREVALRLALGSSRSRILRALFTEAVLISLFGGSAGLLGSVALLRGMTSWQPVPRFQNFRIPVDPDASVYVMALGLALASAFLFGVVPMRQVLRADPYEIIKSGSRTLGESGRRLTFRDILLGAQIAVCAVLVTSSFVALRGMSRSLRSNFGFNPQNAVLMDTVLDMAGYHGDAVPAMQKRMIDTMRKIPGVSYVALVDWLPLEGASVRAAAVFAADATDLRSSNAVARPATYRISPDYFEAAGTALIAGRAFTLHDDPNAPRVAIVNAQFARRMFRSAAEAIGRGFKMADGTRVQIVGIAEDGKYASLTEDPRSAMFVPILQWPSTSTSLVVRSHIDPQQLIPTLRSALRDLDAGLPAYIETWNQELALALFPARMATASLGVLGAMGAMLAITGIFGMAAYSVSRRLRELGIRIALGAQHKQVLGAALGRAFRLLAFGSAAGLILGILATRVLAVIVYQATPRDPLVLAGVVLAMFALGLLATCIPARRVLSLDPVILLRDE